MKIKIIFGFITIILSVYVSCLNAQISTLNFFLLDNQQGLSDNSVTSIVKDADGYIWFGTNNGLNRYDGYEFTSFFTGADTLSLPENKIVKLYLSNQGDLWIGLYSKGICRYNSQMQSFVKCHLGDNSLSEFVGFIKGITEDSDSVLYVASSGGLFYQFPGSDEFIGIPILQSGFPDTVLTFSGLLSPHIAAISPDEKDGLWIAYEDWRITHYSHRNNTFRHYSLQEFRKEEQQTLITSLAHYDNQLWLGALGPGLVVFNPSNGDYKVLLKDEYLVTIQQISSSSQDNLLWLSSASGLVNYNTATGDFTRFSYIQEDNRSLSAAAVSCFFEDENGLYWVGTYNTGVNYAFRNKPFLHMYIGPENYYSLTSGDISAILYDNNGDLWIGHGGGIVEYHRWFNQRRYSIPISSMVGSYGPGTIFDLFQDSHGDIYCSSWQGGLQKFDREKFSFIPVLGSKERYFELFDGIDIRDIEEDDRGRLWLTMHGKGVYVFDKEEEEITKIVSVEGDTASLSSNWVFDMSIDNEGFVWVGTAYGLSRISSHDFSIRNYFSSDDSLSISHNAGLLVKKDNTGNMWIGTDFGLNLYDPERDAFHRIDFARGLQVNQIRSLEQDISGSYWVSTAVGIIRFDIDFNPNGFVEVTDIDLFDKDHGLQSDNFNLYASVKDSSGTLYFGGINGIDFFDPLTIRPLKIFPQLRIKSIEIFGQPVHPGSAEAPPVDDEGFVLFTHKQNMIGIEYVALNYFNVDGNQYYYKLSPIYSDWISVENKRQIVLSNLAPGNYSLSLRVESKDGLTDIASDIFKFKIIPAFWKTRFFKFLMVFLLIVVTVFTVGLYTSNLRRKKVQLEEIVNKRTKELRKKNSELEQKNSTIKETNILLVERQKQISEKSEELKIQSQQLAQSNEELGKLNSTKDKLFSIIAHDLRNPFNSIIGFSDLLSNKYDEYSDEKRKKLIGYLNNVVTNTFSLLENLLHWSRSQSDQIQVNQSDILVQDVVEINHGLIKPVLTRKNLRFKTVFDEHLTVWADKELLDIILRNLISNAIKFTPEGGEIIVKAEPTKDNNVRFEISDTGIGMEKAELGNIFKIGASNIKKGTEGEQGTGLGLLLCKDFVEIMGGNIMVESTKDKGTSFIFNLPANSKSTNT